MNPLVWRQKVTLTPPGDRDKQADRERLLACLNEDVHLPLAIVRQLPLVLRSCSYSLTLAMGWDGHRTKVIRLNPVKLYGIAIDLGSTNIAARVIDLEEGTALSSGHLANPQLPFGSDILTRMFYALSHGERELHHVLVHGLNGLIGDLLQQCGACSDEVVALSIAGNTVMTHFLLNLPVDNIPVSPYVPVVHTPGFIRPEDVGLAVNPEAVIYVFPGAGSYVGGDVISGILATGLYAGDRPRVLIDVGTNAEIAVGTRDWILVGAGAAGPAFDEGVAKIGKRAGPGSVYDVRIAADTGKAELKVFGEPQRAPEGICGSGMVSLLAELFKAGIVDKRGVFVPGSPSLIATGTVTGEGLAFVLYEEGNRKLLLDQRDVDTFMLTKAAMFTLLYVVVRAVGLAFEDIEKVFLTGALGTGIRPDAAATLGLVPYFPEGTVQEVDNSSLLGAEMLLKDRNLLEDIHTITKLITYKEMNEDSEFMREFLSARFIPHTDPRRLVVQLPARGQG